MFYSELNAGREPEKENHSLKDNLVKPNPVDVIKQSEHSHEHDHKN